MNKLEEGKEKEVLEESKEFINKLKKSAKKSGLILGLAQLMGFKINSRGCTSHAPGSCFAFECTGYSCNKLSCTSKKGGNCENRQCSDSACTDKAGVGPKCDQKQCSNSSCTEYACKSQACKSNMNGLCGSKLCQPNQTGYPW